MPAGKAPCATPLGWRPAERAGIMDEEQVEKMLVELPEGHILSTMIGEHEALLEFLDELDWVNRSIQEMTEYTPGQEEFERLTHLARHLVEAESHHRREEQVLFPELEKRGVEEPPAVMRQEHEEMRPRKQRLKELAQNVSTADFNRFKRELGELVDYLVPTLRSHIFKENNILYPVALHAIDDESVWRRLKSDCDAVGYCCFSPGA
jgi:DUF438 domain-containing protein